MPNAKLWFFILMLIAVGFEVTGDILFKKWSLGNGTAILITGLAMYFIGTVFWAISLKYESLSRAINVFIILSLILVTCAGTLLFKEQLSTLNKIGIALGLLSLLLIES